MPELQPYIVGRQSEVERFAALLAGRTPHGLLNLYGPCGIGKTVIAHKLQAYAHQNGVPFAFVDGDWPDLTPDRILYAIKTGLAAGEALPGTFDDFEREYQAYQAVQDVLQRGGGVQAMFDVVGNLKDPHGFAFIIAGLERPISQAVQQTLSNRLGLERYLRGVEWALTRRLASGLSAALEASRGPLAVVIDAYEELESLDDWICRTLIPALPAGVKVVVLGRNALPRVNFDWGEFGQALHVVELPELAEAEAKSYLAHYGLRDAAAIDQVYRFTGGYPLLLVLAVHLAREAGGWDKIGAMESETERDRAAIRLLEHILREERAREVGAFLEKGVVARWFTPEVVGVVLGVSADEGRAIYDRLERHSFVERHPYGLKFHDKIRELLLARLKFNPPEYERIVKRLTDYYAEKAGLRLDQGAPLAAPGAAKYNINIHNASGVVVGDGVHVVQNFGYAPVTGTPPAPFHAPGEAPTTDDAGEAISLRKRLASLRQNLQVLEEKRTEFIDPRSAPPDVEEAIRRTRAELDHVRARLDQLESTQSQRLSEATPSDNR